MGALQLMTIQQVCAALCLSRYTVYALIRTGQLKAKKVGRDWRITQENLAEFINR